ncbi:MAG: prepilin peptidase [Candidatus Promineifilaceae bacterium]|jgi:leader peptidase (prepilin peptidase) / N-methyltransferase
MTLLLAAFYIVVLLLLLLFDIRQRRILNVLALPAMAVALLAAWLDGPQTFLSALFGLLAGFVFFYVLFAIGMRFYGAGSLGFGDVKLAMLLGAILGLKYVVPVLACGMLLAGAGAIYLLLAGHDRRQTYLPYGAYLAFAGIIAVLWLHWRL